MLFVICHTVCHEFPVLSSFFDIRGFFLGEFILVEWRQDFACSALLSHTLKIKPRRFSFVCFPFLVFFAVALVVSSSSSFSSSSSSSFSFKADFCFRHYRHRWSESVIELSIEWP